MCSIHGTSWGPATQNFLLQPRKSKDLSRFGLVFGVSIGLGGQTILPLPFEFCTFTVGLFRLVVVVLVVMVAVVVLVMLVMLVMVVVVVAAAAAAAVVAVLKIRR